MTEIRAVEAAERASRAWIALGEHWQIAYLPDRSSKQVGETYHSRSAEIPARHAFFEFIGDQLRAALLRGETEVMIPWLDADMYVRKPSGKALSDVNFTKTLSLWRKGVSGSENATAVPVKNGRLQLQEQQARRVEIEFISPRTTKRSMTAKVSIRFYDARGTLCTVQAPLLPPPPAAVEVPPDSARLTREIEDRSSADRLRAEARTLDRRGHAVLARELRNLAKRLTRNAHRHPLVALMVGILILASSSYAASSTVRHSMHRAVKAIKHLWMQRQLFMLRDFIRLIDVKGTVVVKTSGDNVYLHARPLRPELRRTSVTVVWRRFDVVGQMLIHRPEEDQHRGPDWDFSVADVSESGTVVLALIADAGAVNDPTRVVRDEDVQAGYIGLRLRDGKVETFDVDGLVPPPRPPKDLRHLIGLNLRVPVRP